MVGEITIVFPAVLRSWSKSTISFGIWGEAVKVAHQIAQETRIHSEDTGDRGD